MKIRVTPGDSGHTDLVHVTNLRLPSGLLKSERAAQAWIISSNRKEISPAVCSVFKDTCGRTDMSQFGNLKKQHYQDGSKEQTVKVRGQQME